jgi:outer membrane immunogenic protein
MKKILLGAAVAMLGIAPALAADMAPRYSKAAPAMVAAAYNWTGFYVGGNVGYGWSDSNVNSYTLNNNTVLVLPPPFVTQRTDGFTGGGQVGYNWQSGMWVFGVEADAAWRDGKSSTVFAFPGGLDFTTFTTKETWLATFRPRVGVASNNFLFYVTGGAAVQGREHTFFENRPTVAGANRTITSDDARVGWTVGAGVEAGFGNWSVGLEYLYADFGRNTTLSAPAQVLGGVAFGLSTVSYHDSAENLVRAKLNYHFNAPVVAKY